MARASASSLEPKSRDWVPLFVAYSAARGTQHITDNESASLPQGSAQSGSDIDTDAESDAGSDIARPDVVSSLPASSEDQQAVQQQAGSHGVHVGAKAWRAQLKEWLGFVGGLKGARGLFRSDDLKQCVVRHLLDTDSGVQQAALKALQVQTRTCTGKVKCYA